MSTSSRGRKVRPFTNLKYAQIPPMITARPVIAVPTVLITVLTVSRLDFALVLRCVSNTASTTDVEAMAAPARWTKSTGVEIVTSYPGKNPSVAGLLRLFARAGGMITAPACRGGRRLQRLKG